VPLSITAARAIDIAADFRIRASAIITTYHSNASRLHLRGTLRVAANSDGRLRQIFRSVNLLDTAILFRLRVSPVDCWAFEDPFIVRVYSKNPANNR
jgi:hypothetical protein